MRKIFCEGMAKELGMSRELIERIFPSLDDLLETHSRFLRKLRERQSADPVIENIGDILQQQVIFLTMRNDAIKYTPLV